MTNFNISGSNIITIGIFVVSTGVNAFLYTTGNLNDNDKTVKEEVEKVDNKYDKKIDKITDKIHSNEVRLISNEIRLKNIDDKIDIILTFIDSIDNKK